MSLLDRLIALWNTPIPPRKNHLMTAAGGLGGAFVLAAVAGRDVSPVWLLPGVGLVVATVAAARLVPGFRRHQVTVLAANTAALTFLATVAYGWQVGLVAGAGVIWSVGMGAGLWLAWDNTTGGRLSGAR